MDEYSTGSTECPKGPDPEMRDARQICLRTFLLAFLSKKILAVLIDQ